MGKIVGNITYPNGDIFLIREMLVEIVRLNNKHQIDNEKGAWYKVIWYNDGTFERHSISAVGSDNHTISDRMFGTSRIPFNPLNYGIDDDDRKWE